LKPKSGYETSTVKEVSDLVQIVRGVLQDEDEEEEESFFRRNGVKGGL